MSKEKKNVVDFMAENVKLLQSISPKRTEHGYSIAHEMQRLKEFLKVNHKPSKYLMGHYATKCNSPGLFLRWMKKNKGIGYEEWSIAEKVRVEGKVVYFSEVFGSEIYAYLKAKRGILPQIATTDEERTKIVLNHIKDISQPDGWSALKTKEDLKWGFSPELAKCPRMVKTAIVLIASQFGCASPNARKEFGGNIYTFDDFDAEPPALKELEIADMELVGVEEKTELVDTTVELW